MRRFLFAALLIALLAPPVAVRAASPAPAAPAPSGSSAAAAPRPPAPGEPADYETFVKDSVVQDGLFRLIRKDGRVYARIAADQFDHDYLQTAVPKNGIGGYGILAGDVFQQEARVLRFARVGKQVVMTWPHTRFLADAGTPIADAVHASTADSVLGVGAIVAQDKSDHSVVVDLGAFLGDVMDLATPLNNAVAGFPPDPLAQYRLDAARTYFGVSKAFAKNVVFEANQTWVSLKPRVDTVVDPRSVQIRVAYNLAELADVPEYRPRLVDDRVGYFDDIHIAFDRTDRMNNLVHYVMRWDMRASDPSKPLSPAVKPIVYTLSNTIPAEYRDSIRRAVLAWNAPFEKIGISGAVAVADQPADPNWDPDDIRYNVIRWLTESNSGGFAEAQITWDPRNGRIFRSGVLIDADLVRFGNLEYTILGLPGGGDEHAEHDEDRPALRGRLAHNDGPGAHAQMMYAAIAQAMAEGGDPAAVAQRTGKDFLYAIVLHEVGHDFGLQHNFIGHMAYSGAQIRDRAFTSKYGIASSVMEYNPANVWERGRSTGSVEQLVLGPYDYHVIAWGYAPIRNAATPEAEVPTLDRWASAWTDPRVRFASDEDAAWDGGHPVDPRVQQFTLTNDPLGWCDEQMHLGRGLVSKLDARFPAPQHPYEDERVAFMLVMGQYGRCAVNTAHWIGGEYRSRSRRGDPHAEEPLVPVAFADQQRALEILDRRMFSENAWHVDPGTLRRLVYTEYSAFANFGYRPTPRHDVSLAQVVGAYQTRALGYLFSPLVLARIADLPSKARHGERSMTLADLFGWAQQAIYRDVADGSVGRAGQVRRNLQRRYLATLRGLTLAAGGAVPYDAQALARHQVAALDRDAVRALAGRGLDLQTKAHLEALHDEASRTLRAQRVVNS